jgi:outer membrane lipoprotein-sorting protein
VSFSGTVTSAQYGSKTTTATVVRIDHKAPTSWRIWYVAPADAYGRLIVSNETQTYQYEPKVGRVYDNPWSESAPPLAAEVDAARVLRNYSVEVGPATAAAGRAARELSLTSKYSGNLVERYWVDNATKLVLRRERYHADGSLAFKSGFDNVRVVNDLPQALFSLTVPPGMILVRGTSYGHSTTDLQSLFSAVSFKFISPKQLPGGFVLEKGNLQNANSVQTVQLIYSDGLRSFSLFENATNRLPSFEASARPIPVGNLNGLFSFVSGVTLVSWLQSGLDITLVGDLTPREFARIGASLKY